MKIVATLHTTDFRGDHAADVEIPYEIVPGETVEALCSRVLKGASAYSREGADFVALRYAIAPKDEVRP